MFIPRQVRVYIRGNAQVMSSKILFDEKMAQRMIMSKIIHRKSDK